LLGWGAITRFYDAIMKALDVVKVGRSDRWKITLWPQTNRKSLAWN
jgi:hypothetical protein